MRRLSSRPAASPSSFGRLIAAALIAVGIWQFGNAGITQAKAWLAPILIERAWR